MTIRNLVNKWLEEGKAAIEIHRKLTLLAEGKPEFTRCIIPGTGLAISARAQDTANQASLIRVIASNDDETVDLIRATTTGWPERSFLINTLGNTPDHKALLVRMVKDPLYMDYEDG